MKPVLAIFLMAALGTGSAVDAAGLPTPKVRAAPHAGLTLIDDDTDDRPGGWFRSWLQDDEDEDDDCDDDDGDDGDACTAGVPGNAGSVAPPKNGLFTGGTAPVVKSN